MDFPDVFKDYKKPIERTSFPHPEFKNEKELQM
jgi:polyphosphate kinase